jgi:soluble lytic murein transglycosylase-like protein
MRKYLGLTLLALTAVNCRAQARPTASRLEAEYYVAAYAQHYGLPVNFVRAIIEQESSWRPCAISPKGAAGFMQLMPATASHLGVRDRCNTNENISGGIRYLAWLVSKFGGDLRLAAAAYLAGEEIVARRGLLYRNREVVVYVSRIRKSYERQLAENNGMLSAALRSRSIR